MDFGILVDVAIGVLMVLVMFSIATSAVNEFLADSLFKLRGKSLAEAIEKLMAREIARAGGDTGRIAAGDLRKAFYDNPDIKVLMQGKRLPSAIEARRYALTALNLFFQRHELKTALDERITAARIETEAALRETTTTIGIEDAGEAVAEKLGKGVALVQRFGNESMETVDAMIVRLEGEFDELMDRVSGWYLRRTKVMLFAIGLALAVGSNIDLLGYADRMLTEGDVGARIDNVAKLVESGTLGALVSGQGTSGATGLAEADKAGSVTGVTAAVVLPTESAPAQSGAVDIAEMNELRDEVTDILNELGAFEVKVGWDCIDVTEDRGILWTSPTYCLWRTGTAAADAPARLGLPVPTASQGIGWVLIAFGVTFGAQMWFDLVKRLVRLRTSGLTGGVATRAEA